MDPGDVLPFRSDLYDKPAEEGGVLTNASSVVLTVTLPDGTTATPSVTNPATGKYVCDYQTTVASPLGRYEGAWLFTFPSGATAAFVEKFDVGQGIVTVDEALHYLRAQGVVTTEPDLDLLQWLTFVATNAVELDLGRQITRRTFVETYDGGSFSVRLKRVPVISITSVLESGSAVTDFILRREKVLQRGSTTVRSTWAAGWENITVTYVAGHLNPPYIVRQVALAAVQGMWQDSQQAPHPSMDEFAAENVRAAVGALTPIEMRAYDELRLSPVLAA